VAEKAVKPRTLTALSVLVVALAAAVVLDRPRAPAGADGDRILPGFVAAEVRRVALAAPGAPEVVLERAGDALLIAAPARVPTDPAAVQELLGTLEYLAFRRRLPAGDLAARGLATPRRTVTITLGDRPPVTVSVGKAEAALGRVWVASSARPATPTSWTSTSRAPSTGACSTCAAASPCAWCPIG
jgi:hypothetical protein